MSPVQFPVLSGPFKAQHWWTFPALSGLPPLVKLELAAIQDIVLDPGVPLHHVPGADLSRQEVVVSAWRQDAGLGVCVMDAIWRENKQVSHLPDSMFALLIISLPSTASATISWMTPCWRPARGRRAGPHTPWSMPAPPARQPPASCWHGPEGRSSMVTTASGTWPIIRHFIYM